MSNPVHNDKKWEDNVFPYSNTYIEQVMTWFLFSLTCIITLEQLLSYSAPTCNKYKLHRIILVQAVETYTNMYHQYYMILYVLGYYVDLVLVGLLHLETIIMDKNSIIVKTAGNGTNHW